jgi:hypothetical protein
MFACSMPLLTQKNLSCSKKMLLYVTKTDYQFILTFAEFPKNRKNRQFILEVLILLLFFTQLHFLKDNRIPKKRYIICLLYLCLVQKEVSFHRKINAYGL